jgi:hypothetical protein
MPPIELEGIQPNERGRQMKKLSGQVVITLLLAGGLSAEAATSVEGIGAGVPTRIVGSWIVVLTVRDCVSGVELEQTAALNSFTLGGIVITTPGVNPAVISNGQGSWKHAGGRTFPNTIMFFVFTPGGTLLGVTTGTRVTELSADGNEFTSADTLELRDLDGNVLGRRCATGTGRRIQ